MDLENEKVQQKRWTVELTENQDFWDKQVFEHYSPVVAHEYERVYELLMKDQSYGAVLQIKDVLEVILKWPVLISISKIFRQKERSDEEAKLLIAILEKPLSLGDWLTIANTLKKTQSVHPKLRELLKKTVNMFFTYELVHWRNEKIGHGALAFDDDDEFKADMMRKLSMLKKYFEDTRHLTSTIYLYLKVGDHLEQLSGKASLLQLAELDGELLCKVDDEIIPLHPFILHRQQEVYFFDTYYPRKQKAAILDYTQGKKTFSADLSEQLLRTKNELAVQERPDSSVDEQTYSMLELNVLQKLTEVNDYISPDYLKNTVRQWLDSYEQGLFLIQMERGTGKTTFSRALDELSIHKYRNDFEDESVRVFYANDSYSYRVPYFLQTVHDTLRKNARGEMLITGVEPMVGDAVEPASAFAKMLGSFQEAHLQHFKIKEKLVLVIDGVDEIPADSGQTIFEFLSDAQLENVYVILTCRTSEELSDFTKSKLKGLRFTDCVTYGRDDLRNVEALKKFAFKEILKQKSEANLAQTVESLLQKADYRFLYLKFMKELMLAKNGVAEVAALPAGEQLIEYYLNHLQRIYGEKYFQQIIDILSILATAYEGLTFREVSDLLHEDSPTFRFLAYLIDLRVFLKVERSYRGNIMYIAHDELKKWILEQYEANIKRMIGEWNHLVERMVGEQLQLEWETPDCDGEIYLLSTIHDYNAAYNMPKWTPEQYEALKVYTASIEQYFEDKPLIYYQSKRRIKLLQDQLKYSKMECREEARVKGKIGKILHSMMGYEQALLQFEAAIHVLRNPIVNCEELATLYFLKGQTLRRIGRFERAIQCFDQSQDVYESLIEAHHAISIATYAETIKERAYTKALMKRFDEALEDYNFAANILQPYLDERATEYQYVLAMIVTNRGATQAALGNIEQSIADFEKGTEIRRDLFKKKAMPDASLLASSLMNLGNVYAQHNRVEDGLKLCNEAVELCLILHDLRQLPNVDYISTALIFRGNCYKVLGQLHRALSDYTEAVERREELLQNDQLPRIHSLINALEVRAALYSSLGEKEKACADYQQALFYIEQLADAELTIEEQLVERIEKQIKELT